MRFFLLPSLAFALALESRSQLSSQNQSAIVHLFQNTLDYRTAADTKGALLLPSFFVFENAGSACAGIGEQLYAIDGEEDDLAFQLAYQISNLNGFHKGQKFWTSTTSDQRQKCSAVSLGPKQGTLQKSSVDCNSQLPVLCSQSGPFKPSNFSDTSKQFQHSVKESSKWLSRFRDKVSFRFLGIQYTNPTPRWTHSTVYSSSNTTQRFDATHYGPQCPQNSTLPSSENCQFLNVFTPYLPSPGKIQNGGKPVMIWVHGGGFVNGAGSDPTFDGGNLASRGDVVVVTINYRLGALGYLYLDDKIVNGNYGLSDQLSALTWVQKNIASFGGDPTRVMIFGQSAGAISVAALLTTPKAKGLFSAAMLASDVTSSASTIFSNKCNLTVLWSADPQFVPPSVAAQSGAQVASAHGCGNLTSAEETKSCLLSVSAAAFASNFINSRSMVQDGEYLLHDTVPFVKGEPSNDVPLIWGFMRDDGGPFIGFPAPGSTLEDNLVSFGFNDTQIDSIVESGAFPVPSEGTNSTLNMFNTTARIETDLLVRCANQASAHAATQRQAFQKIYVYEIWRAYQIVQWSPNPPTCEAPRTKEHPLGDTSLPYFRCHSGELFYLFSSFSQFADVSYRDEADLYFSQHVLDSLASFAWNHDPNPTVSYLEGRNYIDSAKIARNNPNWKPVGATVGQQVREWDYPTSRQVDWRDTKQCNVLALPLNFYL
ncbi:alpha/beta-hydrolase [Atractiella rhizophila]|nr:alpha/beta-hydrolase [Atractiella rhizophila]